jgi:lipid-A-disaccharide synthase
MDCIATADELAVMGLTEVLAHLPRLLRLRRRLRQEVLLRRPAAFVGIDAPEFNLGLARHFKARGLRTVQYVSPQVWAWRQGRVRHMRETCDRVLCLLPFEADFYAAHGVDAVFVGHPLADQIPLEVDRAAARRELGIDASVRVLALLPGSRLGEVQRLGADFAAAASLFAAESAPCVVLAPMASAQVRREFEALLAAQAARGVALGCIRLIEAQAQRVLAAADVALVASGTATLETMLSKRPMVVAYRLGGLTAWLLRRLRLVKVQNFSQPNLLLGRARVPEFFQEQVTPPALARALQAELQNPGQVAELMSEFRAQHLRLRQGGAQRAAAAVLEVARGVGVSMARSP